MLCNAMVYIVKDMVELTVPIFSIKQLQICLLVSGISGSHVRLEIYIDAIFG